jgi:diacylglycerol kinase (ATP)
MPERQDVTRAFVVLNPAARSGNTAILQATLKRQLDSASWTYEVHEAAAGENLADTVSEVKGQGFETFVAAGGDGTVSAVATGLLGTGIPLGILPLGTGNVVARELGIPINLERALAVLTGPHTTQTVDSMQVGDQLYLLAVGAGISGRMMRDTDHCAKRRFGRLSYLWPGIQGLLGLHLGRFDIVVDGQTTRARASEVMVANSGAAGDPRIRWGPRVRWDDARLDVCIVRGRTLLDYLVLAWRGLLGQHARDPNLRFLTAEESIIIDSEVPLPAQGDGDYIGETPLRVQLLPAAVHLIVPQPKPGPAEGSSLFGRQG